jgi:hypothetical protein
VRIYFADCIGGCEGAAIDIPDITSISKVIDACIVRWGSGTLVRVQNELVWVHDTGEKWIGCCAKKINDLASK